MARRWLCSWLLFGAAGGLFFGFFWALLTRQKIKKLYLCLPLTPPLFFYLLLLPPITPSRRGTTSPPPKREDQTRRTAARNQQPRQQQMWMPLCERRVPVMLSSSSAATIIGDGRMTAACLGCLFSLSFALCSLPLHHSTTLHRPYNIIHPPLTGPSLTVSFSFLLSV